MPVNMGPICRSTRLLSVRTVLNAKGLSSICETCRSKRCRYIIRLKCCRIEILFVSKTKQRVTMYLRYG